MKLTVFGEATVSFGGVLVPRIPTNFLRIIVYLLLENSGLSVSRNKIAQMLWSDTDQAHACMNLRQSLVRIRKFQEQYDISLVESDTTHVSLNLASVETGFAKIDLLDFIDCCAHGSVGSVLKVSELYRGDLLAQNEPCNSDFDAWLDIKRVNLRDDFIAALMASLEQPDYSIDEKRLCARKLIDVDPYQEMGYRKLMQTASELGMIAKIEQSFRECAKKLHDDLDVEPEAETIELYQRLMTKGPFRRQQSLLISQSHRSSNDNSFEIQPSHFIQSQAEFDVSKQLALPKIIVLFVPNSSTDPMEQLAGSLVDDITIGLCRLRTLSVIAPYTSYRVVTETNINSFSDLHTQLGVDFVFDSKVVRRDGSCFLSVKLINTRSREIVWAEKQKFDYVLSEQQYRQLSIRIVLSVVSTIEKVELDRYHKLLQDPNAYYWYLIGKREIDSLNLSKVRMAREAFKNALIAAPDFVPALSGVARTMQREWLVLARNEKDILIEGEQIAKKAAPNDPEDERPLRELGTINMYLGKYDESLDYFDQSETLNPQHADLLADYADALTHSGELDLALGKIQRAMALNPLAPDYYYWVGAGTFHYLGRYAEAVGFLEKMNNPRAASRLMAACWARLGEKERAAEYRTYALEDNPLFRIDEWVKSMSLKKPEHRRMYEASLREAGFQ
ncbi:BTAD domain-containing putative transcriptional regulator [Phyllobacterium sp. OV277]|uniref:BTAD domain-containing putative transcriptional regulator n=1 Tax=Phyllobacterium sp. OV277 TaxID=1882772 RepID=UPI0008844EDA|nr:BTAD domain-containing putative transcriptional regulator [Phyllobacterium sp. OV277]SDP38675.1 DNA-binding transcriptional activator of the SARP family [Phyllobacterium sp. OV277]